MSVSSQISNRHFGRPATVLLAKKGIRVTGLQALPDERGSFFNSTTGYLVDDNGCCRVWTHSQVVEAATKGALASTRHVTHDGLMTEVVLRDNGGQLFGIVEHQRGRKWFLHIAGKMTARGAPFRTCKAALAAADRQFQGLA